MSVDVMEKPTTRYRVEIASDGTRKVSQEGAAEDGPRPVDDEQLEAVAGGGNYQVDFDCGCSVNVYGMDSAGDAVQRAKDALESSSIPHEHSDGHSVTLI